MAFVRWCVVQEVHFLQMNCFRRWTFDLRAGFGFSTYSDRIIRSKCSGVAAVNVVCVVGVVDALIDEIPDDIVK